MGKGAQDMERLLLIDTCGQAAEVALCHGTELLRSERLTGRTASASILSAVRSLLDAEGWTIADLSGVGVVNGPGSFTGVRTGLAVAKGLCEATGLPMAAVSRLEVLADAARVTEGFAVLDAGRGELYVRENRPEAEPREFLATLEEFVERAKQSTVVVAEERLFEGLKGLQTCLRELRASDLVQPVRACLARGGSDVLSADANYIRRESEIYKQAAFAGGNSRTLSSR